MFQALLITFREGLEAFLVVAVIAAYLRKTGRPQLIRGVKLGVAISVVTCLAGAWLWLQVPNQPLYEGIAALAAAVFVGALLWQTQRAGRHIKAQIETRIERAAGGASARSVAGVALVTALLITREGLEAVFFLGVQVMASQSASDRVQGILVVSGAAIGLILAMALAVSWTRFAHKLDLGAVLKVTALFLGLFLVQLLVYGVHELAESGVIHGSQAFHDATEVFGPDGWMGHVIAYSLLGAPLLYLWWTRGKAGRPRTTERAPDAA